MQVTKSILCLWASCAAFASFMSYGSAYQRGALTVIKMENLDMGGGQSFALGFPTMVSEAIAAIGVFMAAISLLVSWRWTNNHFFSTTFRSSNFLYPSDYRLADSISL